MFRPRFSDTSPTQMLNNKWWYSTGNIYYPTYGLPNCTCYAYGRVAEIANEWKWCPAGDGKDWYDQFINHIVQTQEYDIGYEPKLGGVMCWAPEEIDPDDPDDPSITEGGHVAVVEQIEYNELGYIQWVRTSNSAWNSVYFWTEILYPENGYLSFWMRPPSRHYYYQGCCYVTGDNPPDYFGKGNDDVLWMMLNYRHIR